MKSFLFFLLLTVIYCSTFAQCPTPVITASGPTTFCSGGNVMLSAPVTGNSWAQKADFGGNARIQATGFNIGNKGYIGLSSNNTKDFWEYDPATNVWTQKADFGGDGRFSAASFSIGSKGYIGTGRNGYGTYYKDFWEYNPATNTWTQKADFGSTERGYCVGFGIGNKGYIGTGYDGNIRSDFWEYDPATDTWAQKADFGGAERTDAVGFSIGSKGYIGTGSDATHGYTNDFWEYDPAADAWTRKADLGGGARKDATGFSIGSKGYIGTGIVARSVYTNDFWEYDPAANAWTRKADLGGPARGVAVGFSIGSKGYIGTGISSTSQTKDFWEYTPGYSYVWAPGGATTSSINVTTAGNYTVTLTDVSGCSATSAATTVTVKPATQINTQPSNTSVCRGSTSTFTVVATGSNLTYKWYKDGQSARSSNNSATLTINNVQASDVGSYSVDITGDCGSVTSSAASLTVKPATQITTQPQNTSGCAGSNTTLTVVATGLNLIYKWYKDGQSISSSSNSATLTISNVQTSDAGNYTVDVIGDCGTVTSSAASFTVTAVTKPVVMVSDNCSSSILSTTATGTLFWSTGETTASINVSNAGTYTVTQTVNGCTSAAGSGTAAPKAIPSAPVVTVSDNCGSSTLSTTATGTLLWSTGETTSSINVTTAGNYTVTQTVNGCMSAAGSGTAAPKAIPFAPVVTVADNCGSSTLSTTATGSLLWSTRETTSSITVTTAGNYTVTQTINGCTSAAGSGTAAPKAIPSAPVVTVSDNCGNSTLSTTVTGTLLWSTGETTSSITVTTAGNYTVTQTVNGCTSAAGSGTAAPKAIPSAPVVTVSDNCGNSTLSTTATGTLLWSTGETTPSITVTSAGTYTLTQTVNGCTSAAGSGTAAPKAIPAAPAVTVSDNCGNSILSTTATGNLLWSTGATTPSITVNTAGSYSVTQTVNGCTSAAGSGTANPKTIPAAPTVIDVDNCGSSTLSTTATGTLLWSTGETTPSITVNNAGTYTVTQTIYGCTSAQGLGTAAPKAIPSAPVVTVSDNCGNSTLSTTATGSLLWSTGATTSSIVVTTAGIYSVTQTVNGCTSTQGSGVASPKTAPAAPVVTVTNNCGSSILSTTATGSLLWSTGATTSSIVVTTAGIYSVTQAVNGCTSATGSGTAAPKAIPTAPVVTVSDNCGNSTLSTIATGSLLWSTGATTSSIVVTTAGIYSVTQAVNGCTSATGSGTAAPKAIPTAPVVTVSDNCGNSTLSTIATGSLLWSTGATTSSIVVTTAGTYSVTQAVNSCTSATGSGTAAPKAIPTAPVVTVSDNCGNSTLSTIATGSLLWSTGATTSSIVVTTAGTYSVTQTLNGCTSLQGSGIASPKTAPAAPVVTVTNNCGSSTLSTTATGSLLWSTGATGSSIVVTTAGTYSVTQTVGGCTSAPGSAIASPKTAPAAPVVTVVNKCGSSTLSTTATGSLLWSTGATTSSISVTTAGTYSVTQTVNSCTSAAGTGTAAPNKSAGLFITAIITNASPNMCSALIPFASYITMSGNPFPSAVYKIGNTVITSPYAFPTGITTVTVTATNGCGFSAGLLVVTVIDNQKPVITCKPSVTKTVSGSNYTVAGAEFNATATDNCGMPSLIYSLSGATTAACKSTNTSLAGVKFNIGTTTITWKATDASGNISTCITVVKVVKVVNATLSISSGSNNLTTSIAEQALKLEVKVLPNPSPNYFTLQLKSGSLGKCTLVVLDAVGRTIEQQNDISPNSTLKIGSNYRPGTYIGVILQGNDKISLKLIKEGN